MKGLNGNNLYLRKTEEKILQAWEDLARGKMQKISIRDSVIFRENGTIEYILWNTTLVRADKDRKNVSIYIASNMEEADRYYKGYSWTPQREYIISNTTKSRLNAFLNYYGLDSLDVHSSMKDWSVKHNGKELKIDSWYSLDLEAKELKEVIEY